MRLDLVERCFEELSRARHFVLDRQQRRRLVDLLRGAEFSTSMSSAASGCAPQAPNVLNGPGGD
jgi:hypothetical protein